MNRNYDQPPHELNSGASSGGLHESAAASVFFNMWNEFPHEPFLLMASPKYSWLKAGNSNGKHLGMTLKCNILW
jgi:hypothetical protein